MSLLTKEEYDLAEKNGEIEYIQGKVNYMFHLKNVILNGLFKFSVLQENIKDIKKISVKFQGEDTIDIDIDTLSVEFVLTSNESFLVKRKLSEISNLIKNMNLDISKSDSKSLKHELTSGITMDSIRSELIEYYNFYEDDGNKPTDFTINY
jgi:hypothetical protein